MNALYAAVDTGDFRQHDVMFDHGFIRAAMARSMGARRRLNVFVPRWQHSSECYATARASIDEQLAVAKDLHG